MRRSRLVQLLGGALMAAALLAPSTALASTTPGSTGATQAAPAVGIVADIKLGCSLALVSPLGPNPHRAITCTWAAPAGVQVKMYRLWRVVDAPNPASLRLIAAIAGAEPLRYTDAAIRGGHDYTYYVAGIGTDGTRVALSNRVRIHVGPAIEKLALTCAPATVGALSGVACHWSAATRPAADHYVLIRSVDGGARERLYRTWIHGRRAFFDTDVKPGQTIRYAVLALTASGRVIGLGGPVVVHVPDATAVSG
jgi:hypothetical protein